MAASLDHRTQYMDGLVPLLKTKKTKKDSLPSDRNGQSRNLSQGRSFTSVQMFHTCSEISYRITDVECIVRAKTLQLNLTGLSYRVDSSKSQNGTSP